MKRVAVIFAMLMLSEFCLGAANLRSFTSRHYRIHTDIDSTLAVDLAKRMDAMYDEYARRLTLFEAGANEQIFEVYLFKNRLDYLKFAGEGMKGTGGVFIPGRNLLAAFMGEQGRDSLRRILQHEAFHQFAHSAISPRLPMWLNEGIAQLFEEGLWTGDDFLLGQVPPHRVRQLQVDMNAKRLIDFRLFMNLTSEQWTSRLNGSNPGRGATQYNQAWAMVHFLVNATDETGQPKYRSRLLTLLRLIHNRTDPETAFKEAFSDNIAGFQDRFVEYAQTLAPTLEATFIEHQDVLADMLETFRSHGQIFTEMDAFKRAVQKSQLRIKYTKGEIQWSTHSDAGAYFADQFGRPFGPDQLYFEPRPNAVLPDIICRYQTQFQLRARFFKMDGKVEHEVAIEPIPSQTQVRQLSD